METNSIVRGNRFKDVPTGTGKVGSPAKSVDSNKNDKSAGVSADSVNVNLSAQAKDLVDARAKALNIARNTPDIREDRVAELKEKINSGKYQVDAGNIADGILREAVRDKLGDLPE